MQFRIRRELFGRFLQTPHEDVATIMSQDFGGEARFFEINQMWKRARS
jgi:hypothetical protein